MAPGVQSLVEKNQAAEEDLLAAIRAGDRDAFGVLVERSGPRLFRAACRLAANREEAEEMAQETLVKAFVSVKRFRGDSGFYTYLYRILLNLWKNRLRSRNRWRMVPFRSRTEGPGGIDPDRIADVRANPHRDLESRENARRLRKALAALEPEARAILVLRESEELDYQEIAATLGIPLGTVRSRLARARARLRALLQVG